MSVQVSLPRPGAVTRLPAGLEASPTLTLRARQRTGALAALQAELSVEAALALETRSAAVTGPAFTATLTL